MDGKPLPGGWVMFRPTDATENSVSAELDEQGQFTVVLPAGDVVVSVDNRELKPREALRGPMPATLPPEIRAKLTGGLPAPPSAAAPPPVIGPSGRYVPIPERYYNGETADLKFTVKAGDQTHDLALTK